jgi:hypothetical protein
MTRRSICRGLVLSMLVIGTLGCETLHSWLRSKDEDKEEARKADKDDPTKPKAVESDTSKIMGVDSDKDSPKPFFKSDRRSGGWSSEAREIEKDLGVN